jgi:hypothetical protein
MFTTDCMCIAPLHMTDLILGLPRGEGNKNKEMLRSTKVAKGHCSNE